MADIHQEAQPGSPSSRQQTRACRWIGWWIGRRMSRSSRPRRSFDSSASWWACCRWWGEANYCRRRPPRCNRPSAANVRRLLRCWAWDGRLHPLRRRHHIRHLRLRSWGCCCRRVAAAGLPFVWTTSWKRRLKWPGPDNGGQSIGETVRQCRGTRCGNCRCTSRRATGWRRPTTCPAYDKRRRWWASSLDLRAFERDCTGRAPGCRRWVASSKRRRWKRSSPGASWVASAAII